MKTRRALILLLLLPAMPALASPYCVQITGIPAQCLYVDPYQCQKEADRQSGRCIANPQELKVPAGQSSFCIADADGGLTCGFSDTATCRNEAERRHGACIPAPPPPALHAAPDPFAVVRPY